MALEMTGSRILAPHLGSSVLVWTALIGIIMAFLSTGYWMGGKMADKNPSNKKLALIIVGGAFCILATAIFQEGILKTIGTMTVRREYAAMLAATLLFGPASLLMGMVSPYVVRVAIEMRGVQVEKTGSIIGRFSAMSAIGSILGTFAGGYYMISYLGSRQSLYFLATMLMFVALIALLSDKITLRRRRLTVLMPIAGLCLSAFFWHGQYQLEAAQLTSGNFGVDTRYSHLQISQGLDARGRHLRLLSTPPELTQSAMNLERPNDLVLDYTRAFALAWQIKPEAGNYLMLGGAGYSVPKYLLSTRGQELRLDVVEIDPGMTALARGYFGLKDDQRLTIHHEDARTYLNRYAAQSEKQGYDIVMGDTFSSVYNIPFQLSTVECAQKIHDSLAEDGIYIGNLLTSITGPKSKLLNAIRGSFAEVFAEVHIFPLSMQSPESVQNVMLLALKKPGTLPTAAQLQAAALNTALPSQNAADEFAQAYHMLQNEWRIILLGDVPPLYDDFAPVELYALPLTE